MKTQKLISQLQSRIAKRRKEISYYWSAIREGLFEEEIAQYDKAIAIDLGHDQKLDKQLLRALCNNMKEHKQAFFAGCDFWEL